MFEKALKNQLHQSEIDSVEQDEPFVPPLTMTVKEMAHELHICDKNAYQLARQDGFPAFKIGNLILVNRAGLQRWIDQQCMSPIM